MKKNFLFTSESVSEGHPDKCCDLISDSILDAFLAQDSESHVAVETLVTTGQVVVAGEVRSKAYVDIPSVVRKTIAEIGYTKPEYGFEANSCGILTAIHEQSPDINQGVSREEKELQGAGDQGCIKKGTLITTKRGYVPIEHVVENDYVLTSGGYRRVYHVQKTGELETITLKTNRGNELTLTPDHLVKTEDGWVEAKDTLGKTLSINKEENIKTETHNHVFTLQTQSTAKYKGEHLGIGSVDVELDCNLAYLLGLYMGDGCCNFRVVYFACSLPDKETKYTEAIKKCGFEPKKTKVGVQVNSVILYQIIEELGLRKKANEKAIPQLIFQSNKDVQSAFVRGCFDSDGSIIIIKREGKSDTFKVKYGTVSKEFAQGLRILLLGLGVNTSVCFSATKGQSHIKQSDGTVIKSNYDIYLVNLRGRDSLIKFSENIGLEVKYKSERLKECLNQTQLVKNINNTETVAEIVKDKVFPVYDISVEGQPEFYANGILVHNCMFGFATDETDTYMPVAHYLATLIVKCLSEIRKEGKLMRYLRPDAKSQVTVEYSPDGIPQRIDTIVVSTQHDEFASEKAMHETILHDVLTTLIPYVKAKIKDERVLALFQNGIKYHVNPTGKFVIGGPAGDTGLTGRKIVVDSYGGYALHGGGAYSSKDPSKVDRSAAYAARYVAKNLVANGLCRQCEIQIGYAIGVAEPVSIYVNDFGTNSGEVEDLCAFVNNHFDLSPYGIDKMLGGLKKPIYKPTAAYGHFGREPYEKDGLQYFPWEKVMSKEELINKKKYE